MPRRETIALPSLAPGTSRTVTAFHYGTRGARPKAYIHASLHADELPGMMCAAHLRPLLDKAEAEGRITGEIILVPVANPIGLAQTLNGHPMGRFAFEDPGTNFNRDWPDLTEACATLLQGATPTVETVRAALKSAVAELPDATENEVHRKTLLTWSIDADYVLDMHCDGESLAHIYGLDEQEADVADLAAWIGAPVVLMENFGSKGSFDACNSGPWQYLRDRLGVLNLPAACFAVTVEFRGQADVSDTLGAADAAGVFGFLTARGIISGDAGKRPNTVGGIGPLDGTDVLKASRSGVVAWQIDLGSHVKAGDVIAEIIDPLADDPTNARTPVVTQASGVFFARTPDRLARPGCSLGKVFGKVPLTHRKTGTLLEN